MQPKTTVRFNRETFENAKKAIQGISLTRQRPSGSSVFALDMPRDIGIKLNNGCNLRCKHCFEWNTEGYHHDMPKEMKKGELPIETLEKIIVQTASMKARLFIWGGEPLYYSKFSQLADWLERDRRITTICTNGILVEENLDSILRMSEQLTMLISLDGFREENDAIRGKGTFDSVMHSIDLLLAKQQEGSYKGRVSVSLTISDPMVNRLYEFIEFFENRGIDSVYLVFPWHIPPAIASRMDDYFTGKFPWLETNAQQRYSWHSFAFRVSEPLIGALTDELVRISGRSWNCRVRLQPALEPHEIHDFVMGSEKPAMNRKQCLAITHRMDVMADGKVNPCKFFPEFTLGDLNHQDIHDVYHSELFEKHREVLGQGLMPVCSRCVLLYNHGI